MIFTTSDFERARQLLIFPNDKLKGELSQITADFKNVKWRIHSTEPDYKTANQINENTQKQKGEYFYLDDLINIKNYLKVLTEKRQWKFPKLSSTHSSSTHTSYHRSCTNHLLGTKVKKWHLTSASPWQQMFRFTSAIQGTLGNAVPMKIRMVY